MHAEIESYLEDKVRDAAQRAFAAWNSAACVSVPLAGILASFAATKPGFPQQIGTKPFVQTRVGNIFAQFEAKIRANNGIRTEDVLGLLLPVGFEDGKIDQVWLATTDGFGSARGDAAHQTGLHSRVKYAIDPQSDCNTVEQILQGLERVDDELTRLVDAIKK